MISLGEFIFALKHQPKVDLVETARRQANTMVKEGNPFFAALIRELADRVEKSDG